MPAEIIVIDDASIDNTEEIAEAFQQRGVQYHRVDFNSPFLSRQYAVELAQSEIVCCIDADDYLHPHYLEKGLETFNTDYRIAIVYSDVEYVGLMKGKSDYPKDTLAVDASVSNFIHSGALFRKKVAQLSGAFEPAAPEESYEDWWVWRKILAAGFWGVKQPALYYYYRHTECLSQNKYQCAQDDPYFEAAALAQEKLTLMVFLSGHQHLWNKIYRFLENQRWPHQQIRLVLVNLAQEKAFAKTLKKWALDCDYTDIEIVGNIQQTVQQKELALSSPDESNPSLPYANLPGKLFDQLGGQMDTPYTWILYDYIIPPIDAAMRMLKGFSPKTFSLSAAYAPLTGREKMAWDFEDRLIQQVTPDTDQPACQRVRGNHFGCTMIRTSIFKQTLQLMENQHPQSPNAQPTTTRPHFDRAFFRALSVQHHVKVDWSIQCLSLSPWPDRHYCGRPMTPKSFDNTFYITQYPDIRQALKEKHYPDGLEHYIQYGFMEGREARYKGQQFDEEFYLTLYPDVRKTFENGNHTSGLEHYEKYGKQEGRQVSYI